MFTSSDFGHNPGETEKPAVTNTADGIRFTVTGLSPISVGWVQSSTPSTPTGPSISSPGSGATTYAMLWRYAGSPAATDKELHFTDADKASGYALEALRWAAENGIMNGYGDGRLRAYP